MNNKFFRGFIIISAFLLNLNPAAIAQELTASEIFEKVNDAVVVIYGYDKDGKTKSQGSGVVISEDGLVLTNFHVISGCDKFGVSHNNTLIDNTSLKAIDYENDLLILKIPNSSLKKIEIGNSDSLKVGEKIYAIGSPLGLENTISEGIISGLRNTDNRNRDKIQITASISPGSSGGAVVNTKGELVGISSSQIKSGQSLNFAVPVNRAVTLLEQSVTNPVSTEAYIYFYRGINAYITSANEDAISNFTEVIRLMPDSTLGYRFRGLTYEAMLLDNKALADYTQAIETDPNDDNGYRFRASFYIARGLFDKAVDDMTKAIIINDKEALNYKYRGEAYYGKQSFSNAVSDLNTAISLDESDYESFYLRGKTYADMNDHKKALADYDKAIELSPDYFDAYYSRARLFMNTNENNRALVDLGKCIEIDPESSVAYNNSGWILFDKAEYESALAYLKKSYELNETDWDALLGASMIYFMNNDDENAELLLKYAVKIEPRLKKGMQGLAQLEKEGYFYSAYQKKIIKKLFRELL